MTRKNFSKKVGTLSYLIRDIYLRILMQLWKFAKVMNTLKEGFCCCGSSVFMQRLLRALRRGWQAWNIHLPVLLNFIRKHRMQQFLTLTISIELSCIHYLSSLSLFYCASLFKHSFFNFFIEKLPTLLILFQFLYRTFMNVFC